jgi:hypothetical protein
MSESTVGPSLQTVLSGHLPLKSNGNHLGALSRPGRALVAAGHRSWVASAGGRLVERLEEELVSFKNDRGYHRNRGHHTTAAVYEVVIGRLQQIIDEVR